MRCNVVVIGDSRVGKTSLIRKFVHKTFVENYAPTSFDKYCGHLEVEKHQVQINFWDTSGSPAFDSVRPLAYQSDTDVFLICFKITDPISLYNVQNKWAPEVRSRHPSTPILLCGTHKDLREDKNIAYHLARFGKNVITVEQAVGVCCQINGEGYVETSSRPAYGETPMFHNNFNEVFEQCAKITMKRNLLKPQHSGTDSNGKVGHIQNSISETRSLTDVTNVSRNRVKDYLKKSIISKSPVFKRSTSSTSNNDCGGSVSSQISCECSSPTAHPCNLSLRSVNVEKYSNNERLSQRPFNHSSSEEIRNRYSRDRFEYPSINNNPSKTDNTSSNVKSQRNISDNVRLKAVAETSNNRHIVESNSFQSLAEMRKMMVANNSTTTRLAFPQNNFSSSRLFIQSGTTCSKLPAHLFNQQHKTKRKNVRPTSLVEMATGDFSTDFSRMAIISNSKFVGRAKPLPPKPPKRLNSSLTINEEVEKHEDDIAMYSHVKNRHRRPSTLSVKSCLDSKNNNLQRRVMSGGVDNESSSLSPNMKSEANIQPPNLYIRSQKCVSGPMSVDHSPQSLVHNKNSGGYPHGLCHRGGHTSSTAAFRSLSRFDGVAKVVTSPVIQSQSQLDPFSEEEEEDFDEDYEGESLAQVPPIPRDYAISDLKVFNQIDETDGMEKNSTLDDSGCFCTSDTSPSINSIPNSSSMFSYNGASPSLQVKSSRLYDLPEKNQRQLAFNKSEREVMQELNFVSPKSGVYRPIIQCNATPKNSSLSKSSHSVCSIM